MVGSSPVINVQVVCDFVDEDERNTEEAGSKRLLWLADYVVT